LYNVACIYSISGEIDKAVSMLERSVNAGFGHWNWIENDSDFEPLHNHPGYQALLSRSNTHSR
jgi:adenylate cyclase